VTLAVMDKFFSVYKRKDGGNTVYSSHVSEASSSRETVCERTKCRKYRTKYPSFRFTNIDDDGEERSQCLLCTNILSADSKRPVTIRVEREHLIMLENI